MARPLSSDSYRGGYPGHRYGAEDSQLGGQDLLVELDNLRSENAQLRQLCAELEQALQEATAHAPDVAAFEERTREYEALLEQKDDSIRQLHQQLQDAQAALDESGNRPAAGRPSGPVAAEDELLRLSEELERERRQLQEDEQSLMEQMRQMEMSMARERAELARQRNDLQRLRGEIGHEIERLERTGALQSKIEGLKSKFLDAANRRGAAPPSSGTTPAEPAPASPAPSPANPSKKDSLMGRLFGSR